MDKYYLPEDDTFLLFNVVKDELNNIFKNENENTNKIHNNYKLNKNNFKVCEVGVGSGYISYNLAKLFNNLEYYGSDINEFAIENTKMEFKKVGVDIVLKNSYLFDGFGNDLKFDLIFFNTPYLPLEDNEKYENLKLIDKAIYGGKQGNEIILDFIDNLNQKLNPNFNSNSNSSAIILYSSLSNVGQIEARLKENLFDFEIIKTKSLMFEDLIVIKIKKSFILNELELKGVLNIKAFAKGKHSIVLQGVYKKKEVIIKVSTNQHTEKETYFLERLKNEDFLGRVLLKGNNYVVKEKANGVIIKDFLDKEASIDKILIVLNNILKVCFRLDELKINKFEMTNPYKHIFVQDDLSIQMIDFERCIFVNNPKTTTQFLQYILRNTRVLGEKNIIVNSKKVLFFSKEYKKSRKLFRIEDLLD